jgi:mannose-1-phosphate guanylyltransferase
MSGVMQAIVLAGGSGTRFWPLSRRRRPKQLLALEGERSLLQRTVDRLDGLCAPSDVWVCTTQQLAVAVREQLPEVPPAQVLCEPTGRNTAPAIGWTLMSMPEELRRQPVAVLPADHRMSEEDAFRAVLARAARAVHSRDLVMTLGVTPRWPETGYGYLELTKSDPEADGVRRVARFTEKPDRRSAERFLAAGNYLWNAGIFVFRGTTFLDRLAEFEPELHEGVRRIAADPQQLATGYSRLKSISIDYAVMEPSTDLATLPLDCGWSDLGSWTALAEVLDATPEGSVRGDVLALDADDNLLFAETGTIAVLGIQGLVVVRTADAVLVVPKERAQEVRDVVRALESAGREDLL